MKKCLILFAGIVMLLSGCKSLSLSLPPLESQHVLITHVKEPLLTVVDVDKKEIVHEEPFKFNVQSFEKIKDRYVAVTGKIESKVFLIDLQTGKVRSLISSVASITDMLYDHWRDFLYLTDAKHNEVLVFDVEKEEIIKRIQVGNYPNALAVDKSFLYVLNGDSNHVTVIDLSKHETVLTFPVVEHPTDIVVNERYVWVGGHGSYGELNEFVYVYEKMNGNFVKKVKAGLMPIAFHIDEGGQELFVLSHGSNELHIIDIDTFRVKKRLLTDDNPYYVTADERYIYVTTLDGDTLHVFDRKTYTSKEKFSLRSGPYGIVLGGSSNE